MYKQDSLLYRDNAEPPNLHCSFSKGNADGIKFPALKMQYKEKSISMHGLPFVCYNAPDCISLFESTVPGLLLA